jgi:hypothetical protein
VSFRIAIGGCSCADGLKSRDPRKRELCARILQRIERLKFLTIDGLAALPSTQSESERIDGRHVALTTFLERLSSGAIIIIVQGFLPSWRFPTYVGTRGVGHIVAEGLVIDPSGAIHDADDQLLWEFR